MPNSEGFVSQFIKKMTHILKGLKRRYESLPLLGKIFVCGLIIFNICVISLLIVVGPDKIAQTLYDVAQVLAKQRYGWLILVSIMIVGSFPPLIGYSTAVTLCGFAYGLKGFLIAAPSTVIGSAIVFVTLRLAFKKKLRSWTSTNKNWTALETVIKAKGLPLIILIRVCPFPPWVYSNALFASMEVVGLWQFVVATLFTLPKIFLSIFISSRLALLSDHELRSKMDKTTKIIDITSIVLSSVLVTAASIILVRLMKRQIRELRESEDLVDERAADALEAAEEGAPLLGNASTESIETRDD